MADKSSERLRTLQKRFIEVGFEWRGLCFRDPDGKIVWLLAPAPDVPDGAPSPLDTLAYWVNAAATLAVTAATAIEASGDPDASRQLAAHILASAAKSVAAAKPAEPA